MATTFTYKITNLDRETKDGYVNQAHYTINAGDGTYTAGVYGSLGLKRAYDVEPVEAVPAVAAVAAVPAVEAVEAKAAVLDADGNVVTPAVEPVEAVLAVEAVAAVPAVEAVEGVLAALIPFADLTEDTVVGWVKDKLGADKVANIEAQLQAQLDEQTAPTIATGLPWKRVGIASTTPSG